jgi:non-lysosomal glucosylceramidase
MTETNIPYTHDELYAPGPQRTFEGEKLRKVAFPLGGIGAGCVSLSGSGELIDWEIFNRPNLGSFLPFTFFSLWAQEEGRPPVARVLQGPPQPPFDGSGYGNRPGLGQGVACDTGAGLPHMRTCTFRGEYPFAYLSFGDPGVPLAVTLEAYNPFIPLNADESSLPAAIFRFTISNSGMRPVQATLAANLFNAVGYTSGRFDGLLLGSAACLGGNLNTFVSEDMLAGLHMTSQRYPPGDPRCGSLALSTTWPDLTWQSAWLRGGWFDSLQTFWDEFSAQGTLAERSYGPSSPGRSDAGTIGLRVALQPGQSATLPIFITWHFPTFVKFWQRRGPGVADVIEGGPTWQNYYARRFRDAWHVAQHLKLHEIALRDETLRFHNALHDSTLPPYVIDALSSQASVLRSPTCLRLEDGTFYGFEGCNPTMGSGEGSCTHVWNYAQTLAFLFPDLQRSMRDADYAYNQLDSGKMCFRLELPLGGKPGPFHAAVDGQMGAIMQVYRDWKLSGRDDWLRALWPRVKKALAYAWSVWDVDGDGVMEGIQHNTYDVEFWGPNPMTGSFYLGALRAAEEMARFLGEEDQARMYRRLFESGRTRLEALLFNGEFFEQQINRNAQQVAEVDLSQSIGGQVAGDPRYQYGPGCLADQLTGQWLASVAGLGYLFDPAKVRQTLASLFRYNWKAELDEHANCQRVFALGDEPGLVLCTWPHGGRPTLPFPYFNEVWCGVEYQAASHMIYEGLVDEGLAIVRGLRARHDGERRNPWNEFEYGSHYTRSLASWSLLTALSGFSFDVGAGEIGFAPRLPGPHFRSFWSVATAWGTYQQNQANAMTHLELRLNGGALSLAKLSAGLRSSIAGAGVRAILNGKPIEVEGHLEATNLSVAFASRAALRAGDVLQIDVVG